MPPPNKHHDQNTNQGKQRKHQTKSSQLPTSASGVLKLVLALSFFIGGGLHTVFSRRLWAFYYSENFQTGKTLILPKVETAMTTMMNHSNSLVLQQMKKRIQISKRRLQNLNISYFVYDDDDISHQKLTSRYLKGGGRRFHQKYRRSVTAEIDMINAMYNHSLRTFNANHADLYFIPTSTGVKWSMERNANWTSTFGKVIRSPTFQTTHGHRHFFISTLVPTFSWKHLRWIGESGLIPYYKLLWNTTVVTNVDWAGCHEAYYNTAHYHGPDDFSDEFFDKSHNMAKYGVSVGWLASNSMPYIEATYEKFQNSKYFLFYHCRSDEEFLNNSTVFRMAPLKPEVTNALPQSSLGHELPPDQWKHEFSNSKFCLVVRGDIPHSHALMRAVRVGCIPVLAADAYHYYAETLKSSILIEDYSILLDEEEFVSFPARTLQKLTQLTKDEIEAKLLALQYAQQLTTMNHPESLFVPALIYEVWEAQKHPFPQHSYPYDSRKTWKVFNEKGY